MFIDMKTKFFTLILLLSLTSCYPPRIVYEIENIANNEKDFLEFQLIAGSTIGIYSSHSKFNFEVSNNSENNEFFLCKNRRLTLQLPSTTLDYKIPTDTISFRIGSHETKKIKLSFGLEDSEGLLYKNIMSHSLNLILNFEDINGKSITKQILLKPVKTRRMRYEKKYDG